MTDINMTATPTKEYGVTRLLGITLLCVSLVAAMQWILVYSMIQSIPVGQTDDIARYSLFGVSGDFFGGVNAAVSASAFALLIVSLRTQQKELSLQREELQTTREVLREQKEEMQEQKESLRRQTFENTFFSLLRAFKEQQDSISASAICRSIYQSAGSKYENANDIVFTMPLYEEWFRPKRSQLLRYLNMFAVVVEFIRENECVRTPHYCRVLRAVLCPYEIRLIATHYGLQSDNLCFQMRAFLEEHHMLVDLPADSELSMVREAYKCTAFREKDAAVAKTTGDP